MIIYVIIKLLVELFLRSKKIDKVLYGIDSIIFFILMYKGELIFYLELNLFTRFFSYFGSFYKYKVIGFK